MRRSDAGFTLLELLVALAILGLVLVTLFRLVGTSLEGTESRERRLAMATLAEAVLEAARVTGAEDAAALGLDLPPDLEVTLERGTFADAPIESASPLGGGLTGELGLLRVRIEDAAGRSFAIATLDERPRR